MHCFFPIGSFLKVAENRREFSMGTASMSDSIGTAVAGGVALPMHNWFCTLHR